MKKDDRKGRKKVSSRNNIDFNSKKVLNAHERFASVPESAANQYVGNLNQ